MVSIDSECLPTANFVGLLQEKCLKEKLCLPVYVDVSEGSSNKNFTYTCTLGKQITKGESYNKKIAKQQAARLMISKFENSPTKSTEKNTIKSKSAISMLNEYCAKENMNLPLYSEKSKENGEFVMTCTVNNFTGEGKGSTKKIAKESSANVVMKHFNIHTNIKHEEMRKYRHQALKNSVTKLHELCQIKKLHCKFSEESCLSEKKQESYIATFTIGDLVATSKPNSSKKIAKMEAAAYMVTLINCDTPEASPASFQASTSGTSEATTNKTATLKELQLSSSSDEENSWYVKPIKVVTLQNSSETVNQEMSDDELWGDPDVSDDPDPCDDRDFWDEQDYFDEPESCDEETWIEEESSSNDEPAPKQLKSS